MRYHAIPYVLTICLNCTVYMCICMFYLNPGPLDNNRTMGMISAEHTEECVKVKYNTESLRVLNNFSTFLCASQGGDRMSAYTEQMEQVRRNDLSHKAYLTDMEGAAYLSIGKTKFRAFAAQIGCKKRIGRRVLNDKAVIDAALKRGDIS